MVKSLMANYLSDACGVVQKHIHILGVILNSVTGALFRHAKNKNKKIKLMVIK
jgi:hypothetical protein